jgi:hypothetical protein
MTVKMTILWWSKRPLGDDKNVTFMSKSKPTLGEITVYSWAVHD